LPIYPRRAGGQRGWIAFGHCLHEEVSTPLSLPPQSVQVFEEDIIDHELRILRGRVPVVNHEAPSRRAREGRVEREAEDVVPEGVRELPALHRLAELGHSYGGRRGLVDHDAIPDWPVLHRPPDQLPLARETTGD